MATNQTRRTFLHDGSLLLLGAGLASTSVASPLADDSQRRVRVGMVTDLHYADKPPAGTRRFAANIGNVCAQG